MDRKQKMIIAAVSVVAVILVVTGVTASSLQITPLNTVRMEQASSKMSFLPTSVNEFTYSAENGYILSYDTTGCCSVEPLAPTGQEIETCWPECTTTEPTCPSTCEGDTCQGTCSTCSTCQGQGYTCDQTSCQYTCESTCGVSCGGTCSSTCEQNPTCGASTCDYDCPVSVYVCN